MKEYHYCYIITNLKTNKQYVGDRTCNCLPEEDIKYLGSGVEIINEKKKYGKEYLTKKILEIYPDRYSAFLGQEKYIKKYNTLKPNGYNISPTGGTYSSGHHSEETIKKMITIQRELPLHKKKNWSTFWKNVEYVKKMNNIMNSNEYKLKQSKSAFNRSTPEYKAKMSKIQKERLAKKKNENL